MDKIYINNLQFFGFHGVFEEEKRLGQKFIISLELELDTREAGKNGDLEKTVHYGFVAEDVKKIFLEKSLDLLESCAEMIAREILKKYRIINKIKVMIKKPNAPIQLHFEDVAVEIERKWHKVYLSLGTNIGNKKENLDNAIKNIEKIEDSEVIKISSYLETKPFGYLEQDDFLNCCVEIKTLLSPKELLREIQKIELDMGRVREIKWGPRIIDIDILLFDKIVIEDEELAIPHLWLTKRDFVLQPLSEIAPYIIHPLENKSILMLWEELKNR